MTRAAGLGLGLLILSLLLLSLVSLSDTGLGATPQEGRAVAGTDSSAAHNCRLWALIGSDYPDTLIADHLRDGVSQNLKRLGGFNYDGWGLAYYPSRPQADPFRGPIIRRGGPPATNPYEPEYDLTVDEMAAVGPRAAVGHVRLGTSGHIGIPNPHPFLHRGMLFAHNGGANVARMEDYLDKYLTGHPPDYTHGAGITGHIDSELFFLCLLKYIDEHPELDFAAALTEAIKEFISQIGGGTLNFVLTDGDTLYALNYHGDNLRYLPSGARAGESDSPFWAVASVPLGSEPEPWGTIPASSLGIFIPGEAPVFHSVVSAEKRDTGGAAMEAPGAEPLVAPGAARQEALSGDSREAKPHNCRFWALIGQEYPEGLIDKHLFSGTRQNLRLLGTSNNDGWGLGYFLSASTDLPLRLPVIRRGGPAASSPYEPEYGETVDELEALRPRAAIAHVRLGTSGHFGIPDPHPFLHEGMLFAHNGQLLVQALESRVGLTYLTQHPTDYFAGYDGTSRIDSELYFLYLLKLIGERPALPFTEALLEAVRIVTGDTGLFVDGEPTLNFVLTRGDTLYALQYYGPGYNLEQYYPAGSSREEEISPFWIVASESLGSWDGGWAPVPDQTLAVFIPGEVPLFLPVEEAPPSFSLGYLELLTGSEQDLDGDGWHTGLEICGDPNVSEGTARVSLSLLARPDGGEWFSLGSTRYREITDVTPDTLCLAAQSGLVEWPDSLARSAWDLKIELWQSGVPEPVLVVTGADFPEAGLDGFLIEGLERDMPDTLAIFSLGYLELLTGSEQDLDGDGWHTGFEICGDPNVSGGTARVSLSLLARPAGGEWFSLGNTRFREITDIAPDTLCLAAQSGLVQWPDSLARAAWDLKIELLQMQSGVPEPVLVVTGADFPEAGLDGFLVEGVERDTPDTLAIVLGQARPNPSNDVFLLPLHVREGVVSNRLELFDLSGRLLWSGACPVESDVLRFSPDELGLDLPSGVYICRVPVGGREEKRRLVVVR